MASLFYFEYFHRILIDESLYLTQMYHHLFIMKCLVTLHHRDHFETSKISQRESPRGESQNGRRDAV